MCVRVGLRGSEECQERPECSQGKDPKSGAWVSGTSRDPLIICEVARARPQPSRHPADDAKGLIEPQQQFDPFGLSMPRSRSSESQRYGPAEAAQLSDEFDDSEHPALECRPIS
jgi:hypothetical protein